MPELQNEIPTDSELLEYFLEYFAFTVTGEMFAPLKRAEGQELRVGCDRLIKKAGESIFASLQRLNRLDRTELYIELRTGRSTASTTAGLLRVLELSEEAKPVLETGCRSAEGVIVNWRESVLVNLSEV